jgi:hypothetical protein
VILVVIVAAGVGPTGFGIWLAVHFHVASPGHAAALGPALVAAILAREIRRRSGPGALPIRSLVPASAGIGLVATAALVGAWSHLCVAALWAAWRAFDSLSVTVGMLVIAFALAQAYSALIFFGYVPGAARDATNRRAYGEPLLTSEPELAAVARTLGAGSLALAHDASCALGADGVIVLGAGLLGAVDARHLGPLAAFAAARRRHGEPTRWARIEAALGRIERQQAAHEFVFTPFSVWYWMLPAGGHLLAAAVAYAHAAAERAALAELRAGASPASGGAYRERRSGIDAALSAQVGAATVLMRRTWTAITVSEVVLRRLGKEQAIANLYRCEVAPEYADHPVTTADLCRETGLSAEACRPLEADLSDGAAPAAAEPLLDPYERELTRRILRESLRHQRLHAMALGGEVERSLL